MDKDIIIQKAITIIKQYGVDRIVLFGSFAQGTATKDSDIDLFVVKDLPETEIRPFRIQLKKALWKELGHVHPTFDIFVDNDERIEKRIALGDLFYKEIYTKGKTIYA